MRPENFIKRSFRLLLLSLQIAFGQTKTVIYAPSAEIFQNPERGFFQVEVTGMVPGTITPYQTLDPNRLRTIRQTHSLVFRYFGLKQWRTVDLPENILRSIGDDFAAIRSAGLKCIPRFCYAANIGEPDAPLDVILRHLDQLKPILRTNKDIIAVMQAGFIGAWGEWHSSTNGNDSTQSMRIVLNKVLDVLPAGRMTQVRTPQYKQAIFLLPFDSTAAVTSSQAFTQLRVARVGHHNDCFLADASDMGTYRRSGQLDTLSAKPYLQRESRFVPMGGETCQRSSFAHCANALYEMERLHWSFLNDAYDENVIGDFRSNGCFDEMNRKLGYRFSLVKAEFTSIASHLGSLTFKLKLTNSGWASPYNRRDVEVILRNAHDGGSYRVSLNVDPRRWLPRDTVDITATIGVPAAMASGRYSVLLNLPDPEMALHRRAEYSIRLANENTWEPGTGFNKVLDSLSIEAGSGGTPYRGTLWLQPLNRK